METKTCILEENSISIVYRPEGNILHSGKSLASKNVFKWSCATYPQLTSLLPKVFIAVHLSAKKSFVLLEKANVALWSIMLYLCWGSLWWNCGVWWVRAHTVEHGPIISYEVLRDFMFHFLKGRCTLFTYYSVWQEIMDDANILNFKRSLSYHHWRFAWYSFLDLLDIDYEEGFCCPICGKDNGLDIVICDATAHLWSLVWMIRRLLVNPLNHEEWEDKLPI